MSNIGRIKGKLYPSGIDTEHFTEEDYESLIKDGMIVIDGEVYEVEYDIDDDVIVPFTDLVFLENGCVLFDAVYYSDQESLQTLVDEAVDNE